jgi:hypothetical protein
VRDQHRERMLVQRRDDAHGQPGVVSPRDAQQEARGHRALQVDVRVDTA